MAFNVDLFNCMDAWSNMIDEIIRSESTTYPSADLTQRVSIINLVLSRYHGEYYSDIRMIKFDSEESYTHFLLVYN